MPVTTNRTTNDNSDNNTEGKMIKQLMEEQVKANEMTGNYTQQFGRNLKTNNHLENTIAITTMNKHFDVYHYILFLVKTPTSLGKKIFSVLKHLR